MYCVKCGKEIAEGSEFCSFCGMKQRRKPQSAKPVMNKWWLGVVGFVLLSLALFLLQAIPRALETSADKNAGKATISAKDFDTRLGKMSSKLDASELSEIVTRILGCPVKEFEGINGWYEDTDVLKKKCYKKSITLDKRKMEVELLLGEDDRVERIKLGYEEALKSDYVGYIRFNPQFAEVEIDSYKEGVRIKEDEIPALLATVTVEGGSQDLDFTWHYTGDNGDTFRVSYYYTYHNEVEWDLEICMASLYYSRQ